MKLLFLLLISFSGFAQAKKDSVKKVPHVLTVTFVGEEEINYLLEALNKSDAAHNSVVAPLLIYVREQIQKQQIQDTTKIKK